MAQFYFLSILLNIIAGLILVYGNALSKNAGSDSDGLSEVADGFGAEGEVAGHAAPSPVTFASLDNKIFRLVVGVLSVFVGLMKLLSVFRNDIPIVGDLFPALAGMVAGASLLFDYYSSQAVGAADLPAPLQVVLVDSKKYLGIACIVVAVLHFVFPQVVLL